MNIECIALTTRWHLKVSDATGAQRLQKFIQNMCNDGRRIVLSITREGQRTVHDKRGARTEQIASALRKTLGDMLKLL